jgi:hypothetical protein
VKRPTKKEIKEAVEKLKARPSDTTGGVDQNVGQLSPKKSSKRIRKQGV